ncbi:MAG TPA: HAMP domain-containing sensor histidine kinase [Candidatus Nanoarchaeia archaeon]|nr:HAMP domain-containing sensor histidine kinase [Candidatus Nanoarchaeia archaeon]
MLDVKKSLSRERLQFYYSIFIVLLVPALLVVNTLWLSSSVKRDFDTELRRKANLASNILGVAAADDIHDQAKLQQLVSRAAAASAEINELTVLVPDGQDFRALASTDGGKRGQKTADIQAALAFSRNQPIAALVYATNDQSHRSWRVLTPLSDSKGQLVGVINTSVSLFEADKLVNATLSRSFWVLIATIVIILLLLLNHFRFVEYAELFRKLKEVDQLKDDFIQIATHELKAPMSVIKGYVSLVIEGDSGKVDAEGRQTLQMVMDQTDRLNHLVVDLLNVSRLEQGRTVFELQAVSLTDMIRELVQQFNVKASSKGLKLEYKPAADTPKVRADIDRANEVFTNLIDNAIKYSQSGTVTITHSIDAKIVKTVVKDTGIGMSAAEREKLFSRFYRIRNDKTKDISGTGLGLWIIKQYVEKMGGRIYVESTEGVGSQFTVELPIASSAKSN